jgi:hypothetical protein
MATAFKRCTWSVVRCGSKPLTKIRSIATGVKVDARKPSELGHVECLVGHFNTVDLEEFRRRAFVPELPILISQNAVESHRSHEDDSIPAFDTWFTRISGKEANGKAHEHTSLNYDYLDQFGASPLTLETITYEPSKDSSEIFAQVQIPFSSMLAAEKLRQNEESSSGGLRTRYYLAQCQFQDLPRSMQDDIKTPRLVLQAGKGDIYDANVWIGQPPTYTPLHKDPNPNLFVQIASDKVVRIYKPRVGAAIFRQVQAKIGANASSVFRGEEMMHGPERRALEEAVWGEEACEEGLQVTVRAGDALFIPKGWWHSIRSIGNDINASVSSILLYLWQCPDDRSSTGGSVKNKMQMKAGLEP